jgi:3-hydroxyacyl-CoA dehydrogenase
MFHADTVGLPRILTKIREFQERHGKVWEPSRLLVELAEAGRTFASVDEPAAAAGGAK